MIPFITPADRRHGPRHGHQRADHGVDHGPPIRTRSATPCPASSPASPSASGARSERKEATWPGRRFSCQPRRRHAQAARRQPRYCPGASVTSAATPPEGMAKYGARIVGLSDVSGGVYNAKGLDLAALEDHVARTGSVKDFPGGDRISNDDLLVQPCEVLIPRSARSRHQREKRRQAPVPHPRRGRQRPHHRRRADAILRERPEIFVIPDIICNSGGVIVSYFEWVQDLQSFFWAETEIFDKLLPHPGSHARHGSEAGPQTQHRPPHRRAHSSRHPKGRRWQGHPWAVSPRGCPKTSSQFRKFG